MVYTVGMIDIDVDVDLEKKKAQLAKAQTKLDAKTRRNKRRRESKLKLQLAIQKSKDKIKELQDLIAWHERQISGWEKKLRETPGEEDFAPELTKRDRIASEIEKMEVLGWKIKNTQQTIEENKEPLLTDFYEKELKKFVREFKSAKGHGF